MDSLFKGAVKFREKSFAKHHELFKKLGHGQEPHTLFIGCSDSRVVPELITKTMPGELFVVRNIANIVPKYRVAKDFVATTAAIEYAVLALNVRNIVVCGHSNCGGCYALNADDDQMKDLPNVKHWMEQAEDVKQQVTLQHPDASKEEREWLTEQINIVSQMRNLMTYPFIKDKFLKGEIKILGWYYIIGKGEVYNFNTKTGEFELIA